MTEQNQGVDEILRSSRISFLQLANRPMHMKTEESGKLASKFDPQKFHLEKHVITIDV